MGSQGNLSEDYPELGFGGNKVSPHYERIAAALKEVESLKKKEGDKIDLPPSILMQDDELTKFEGLLKKIQNHREVV